MLRLDNGHITMPALVTAVRDDFIGHESLRQLLLNKTPKYGNDDEYADAFVTLLCDNLFTMIDGRGGPTGSTYHVNYLSTTLSRLLRVRMRGDAGRTTRMGAGVRRHLACARGGPSRPHRGHQVGGAHGPRAQRRHAAQPEVHTGAAATLAWTARSRSRCCPRARPLILNAGIDSNRRLEPPPR
jgi:hypothetical protein